MENTTNIFSLLWYVCTKWRRIIGIALIFAFLFAGYKIIDVTLILSDEEKLIEYKQKIYLESVEYINQKETLSREIVSSEYYLENHKKYMDESILMKFNAYDIYQTTVEVFVDTNYQIMPEMFMQNLNPIDEILKAYTASFRYGVIFEDINNALEYNSEIRYIKEFVSYSVDNNTGFITFNIKTDSQEDNEVIASIISDYLSGIHTTVNDSIDIHDMEIYPPQTINFVDETLLNTQYENNEKSIYLERDLELLKNELFYLVKPSGVVESPDDIVIGVSDLIKSSPKYFVLGGFVGAFICIVIISLPVLISKKMEERDFTVGYKLCVLGYKNRAIKKMGFIDKLVEKTFNRISFKDDIEFYDYISYVIDNAIEKDVKLHITGSIDSLDIKMIYDNIKGKIHANVTFGADITKDKLSLENANKADTVVLVEKLMVTSISNFRRQMEYLNHFDKKVTGVIVLQ